ncbi:putative salicylate hydroxylase [Nemania serpens]|nr:putative salicylate hydroxylase [Nemania serpens]
MDKLGEDSIFSERRAVRSLSIIVVGAGIGGLAIGLCMRKTGHDVDILEKRKQITEVGAGIQLAPNASRILRRFGVLDEIMKHATILERNSSRRWKDDEELGSIALVPDIEKQFGAPLAVLHRADFQRILLNAAIESGCRVLVDHEVVDIDHKFLPKLTAPDRQIRVRSQGRDTWMSADLILAADGMNSMIRKRMARASGNVDQLISRPESAYRFMLPIEIIRQDKRLMGLLDKNQGMRYMGPGGHIMAYPLRKNTLYNVVLVHETNDVKRKTTSWTATGKMEEVSEHYRGWSPMVQDLISHARGSEVLETPMNDMSPLPTWVKGRIALTGDACHYMLPYVAQGASNSVEDAGVLAMAFTCTDDIELALELYQSVRKARGERIQASATNTGNTLHLPDGEAQRTRDESIRAASRGMGANPDQWNDKQTREFMWRVDVMAETIVRFESLRRETGIKRERQK